MTSNLRCLVCDLAFEMQMSEIEFYDRFELEERNQLVATYRSKIDRQTAMAVSPTKPRRRQGRN